jgi:hypothetical protein
MALVYRNGRPRLQRSVRRDGRVTTDYVASGELALIADRLENCERDYHELEMLEQRARREVDDANERGLTDYCDRVEDLARAALYAAGYHRPKREWRRRRARHQDRGENA